MKVLLVDDHLLFRVGVRRLLTTAPGYEVVGEAATAADAFEIIDRVAPEIVLMDVALPGTDGILATREILRRAPKTRVLVLSAHDQITDVVAAFDAGASGYALKDEVASALLEALRVVSRGARYLAPALVPRLAKFEERRRGPGDVLGVLSTRERQIFLLAAECMIARDIAAKLGIARKTVDTHLNRINKKLSLRNMAELVRLAASLGLLQSRSMPLVPPGTVVMVIDDDADMRNSTAELLTIEGYDARAIASAEAAWTALEQGTEPAAIILDLWLRDMSGGEFIRRLRASRHAAVPVLVLSGTRSTEALELDVDAISHKPIEATALASAVDKVVRLGPKRAALISQPRSGPSSASRSHATNQEAERFSKGDR
ncbi:MAG TPA: response regulator [Polyangia bacterium]|nr:response regulator [Polyangia bacterium]